MQYPAWEIGQQGPQAVADYLTWILDDDERIASAADYLGYLKIGMHFLTAAQRFNELGEVVDKLELNFWSEKYPPEKAQASGGHGHSRSPELYSFIDPDARQEVAIVRMLPPGTKPVSDFQTEERQLAMLNKVDDGKGLGTLYHPVVVGSRLTSEYTVQLPPLSRQWFDSTVVHDVRYYAPNDSIGVTVQRQGPVESPDLNGLEGLTLYKGLTETEARQTLERADALKSAIKESTARLVGSTVLLRPFDFDPTKMEARAERPPQDRFEELALGALRSLKRLGAKPRVAPQFISRGDWVEDEPRPQVGEFVAFNDLPADVQADLLQARELVETRKIVKDKNTKVGCVIANRDTRYTGVNIKRHHGDITHAEELAASEAVFDEAYIERVALYGEVDGKGRPAIPCGNCREILAHALLVNGQEDITIYAMGDVDQDVVKVRLSELLPLAKELLHE